MRIKAQRLAKPIAKPTDVRNSRGAGAIFRHNGKLFRPTQDCSRNYGHSITIREIVLDRYRYREKPDVMVRPLWARGSINTPFSATFTATTIPSDAPEPASVLLMGAGLLGVGLVYRRKTCKS